MLFAYSIFTFLGLLYLLPGAFAGPPRIPIFHHHRKVGYKYAPFNQKLFASAARRVENCLPIFDIITHKYFSGPNKTPRPADLQSGQEFIDDHYRFRKLWQQSLADRRTMKDQIFLFNYTHTHNGPIDDAAAVPLANMVKLFNHLQKKTKPVHKFALQSESITIWVSEKTFREEAKGYITHGEGPWWCKKLSYDSYILENQLKDLEKSKDKTSLHYFDIAVELAVNRKRTEVFNAFQV